MEAIGALLLLLLTARAFGAVAERLFLPSAVGEMLAGITLVSLGYFAGPQQAFLQHLSEDEVLAQVADLGIFFLLLMAGVEMQLSDTVHDARKSLVVAFGGVLVPLVAGVALGFVYLEDGPQRTGQALLVGVALSITAIAASAKILQEFGLLRSEPGRVLITAALFDDILGLFLLALLSSVIASGALPDAGEFVILLAKVTVFFLVTGLLGVHVYPRISREIHRRQAAQIEFGALVIVALSYGFLAELLGLHWAVGAFMAGLFMDGSRVGKRPHKSLRLMLNALTAGILGPLFFAWIGLQANLSAIIEIPGFLFVLIVVAFLTKVVGGGFASLAVGYGKREAAIIGVGMAPRGEIMIVVISVALAAGLVDHGTTDPVAEHLFSALILMALANTVLAPLALRVLLRSHRRETNPTRPD